VLFAQPQAIMLTARDSVARTWALQVQEGDMQALAAAEAELASNN